jgi:peptide/nickel transport system ATP-binding protein
VPLINSQRQRLASIPGNVASLDAAFAGCRFAGRCPFADTHCRSAAPPLAEIGSGHLSRCWKTPLEALVV